MPGVRDRVAVVTGAANGLGREIALLLAREGAHVALGDLDASRGSTRPRPRSLRPAAPPLPSPEISRRKRPPTG